MTFWMVRHSSPQVFDFRFWIGSHNAGLKSELSGKTAATSENGLNGPRTRSGGLDGALPVERFELTKMIPADVLARADRVIR